MEKPTVLVDLEGRYLGTIDTSGALMDVDIIMTSASGDAEDSDIGSEEIEDDPQAMVNQLLSSNARSTFRPSDFKALSVRAKERESDYLEYLFDPKFVTYSREFFSEGTFSVEEDSSETASTTDESEELEQPMFASDLLHGYHSDSELELSHHDAMSDSMLWFDSEKAFDGREYDAVLSGNIVRKFRKRFGRGKPTKRDMGLVVSYIFMIKGKVWVIATDEDKPFWEFPTYQFKDKTVTAKNVTERDVLALFTGEPKYFTRPELTSNDASVLVQVGDQHVVYIADLEPQGTPVTFPRTKLALPYRTGTWADWKTLKPALNLLSLPGEQRFRSKTRKTMRKLRALGYIGKERILLRPRPLTEDLDSSAEAPVTFEYFSVGQGKLVSHGPEDDHLFFFSNQRRGRSRSPSPRRRVRSPSPGRLSLRRRSPVRYRRASSLPPGLRRGLSRLGPQTFWPGFAPYRRRGWNYGRARFGYGNVVPVIPYLPFNLIGLRSVLFRRPYVIINSSMPYYSELPDLSFIEVSTDPVLLEQQINALRFQYSRLINLGYDIVPNFQVLPYRFEWVRDAARATPTTILR